MVSRSKYSPDYQMASWRNNFCKTHMCNTVQVVPPVPVPPTPPPVNHITLPLLLQQYITTFSLQSTQASGQLNILSAALQNGLGLSVNKLSVVRSSAPSQQLSYAYVYDVFSCQLSINIVTGGITSGDVLVVNASCSKGDLSVTYSGNYRYVTIG